MKKLILLLLAAAVATTAAAQAQRDTLTFNKAADDAVSGAGSSDTSTCGA